MNILIVEEKGIIPVVEYGGTQRVIWYLGKELSKMGHTISYLVSKGSSCDFAQIIERDLSKSVTEQIPEGIDIVHFNSSVPRDIDKPYINTVHGNRSDSLNLNTVFVSGNHAKRFGSRSFVYNGLDWDDYGKADLNRPRNYYHFLGKAAWSVKNVKGAINVVKSMKGESLKVLGGYRFNFKMGLRFTFSSRIKFYGMVGGQVKNNLLEGSKGLIFPVIWHEPFGLAITESLYFGAPVFGTPYGSLPELITKEVGFLSNSMSGLVDHISGCNYSPKTCHEYARDLFNSKIMAEEYLKKYEIVLSGKTLNQETPQPIADTDKPVWIG